MAKPRTPTKTARRSSEAQPARKLPRALAERAEALAKGKIARIVAAAKKDIAFIRSKRRDITAAFYDMGEALLRLKKPEVFGAFGRGSWEEFCTVDLGLSATQAQRLVDVVASMSREEAIALGTSTKASSVAELIGATAAADTVADALEGKVVVEGRKVDVKKMSANAIARAAKTVRAQQPRHGKRGRGIAEAERSRIDALAKRLGEAGLTAHATAKAGLMNRGARVVIEAPLSELRALGKLLARS